MSFGIAAMAMSIMGAGIAAAIPGEGPAQATGPHRRKSGKGWDTRRGKGFQAKAKKKTNRVRLGRAVRRKHRKARKAA